MYKGDIPEGPRGVGPARAELEDGQFGQRVRLENEQIDGLDPRYGNWDALVAGYTTDARPYLYVLIDAVSQLIGRKELLYSSNTKLHAAILSLVRRRNFCQMYVLTEKEHRQMQTIGRPVS